jgi:acyl carrier protein
MQHGRQEYGTDYSFMDFQVLDIENSPLEQGFEPDAADLIIAGDVLHATRNIDNTLHQIKSLLKANGLLILIESTQAQLFPTLTFGLTEGWWLFEDAANRLPGSPFLSSMRWRQLLEDHGFRRVRIVDAVPVVEGQSLQSVIIAESDGRVLIESDQCPKIPDEAPGTNSNELPNNGLERKIAAIWQEVLGYQQIGIHDNFQDLGGDSIMATKIISRLEKSFPLELTLKNLFGAATIADMAEIIEEELIHRIEDLPEEVLKQMLN